LKEGKNIPVYGNGKNIREWIYVDDHNKSILEIAARGISGGVYNIGSGLEFSNLDMVEMLVKEVTEEQRYWLERVEFVEDRKGHDFRYAIDSIHYIRGFALTEFEYGIKQTVAHYIK
jgi:dTDP-glucose 4,6-dehydratase